MSEDVEVQESAPDRRSIMKAAALVVVPVAGVGTVAACSSSSSSGTSSNGSSGGGSSSGGSSSSSSSGSSGSGNGTVSVASSAVPVGGGYIDKSNLVVVTQPEAGTYKAFTAVCTHQGCTVANVSNNQIVCPCHGSIFSAKDGSVINGPASSPLGAMTAKLNGTNVDVTGS